MLKDSPDAPERVRLSARFVLTVGTTAVLVLVGLVWLYVPAPPPASSMMSVRTYSAFEQTGSEAQSGKSTGNDAQTQPGAPESSAESYDHAASSGDRSTQGLFMTYCAQCHGRKGDGDAPLARMMATKPPHLVNGPFRFGRDIAAIAQLIRNGAGAMPGFSEEISPAEAESLSGYVLSLEGSAPAPDSGSAPAEKP